MTSFRTCVYLFIFNIQLKKLLIPLKRRRRQEPPDLAWKMKALYYRVLELRINSSSSLKFLLLIYAPRLIQVVEDHRKKTENLMHIHVKVIARSDESVSTLKLSRRGKFRIRDSRGGDFPRYTPYVRLLANRVNN